MKTFIIVNDIAGLQHAIENGFEFAYPVDVPAIRHAVKGLTVPCKKYSGGALFELCDERYQYMYLH